MGLSAGSNMYTYVQSNPLNWSDSWGLKRDRKCLALCIGDKMISASIDIFIPCGGFLPFDSSILMSMGGYTNAWINGGFFDAASAIGGFKGAIVKSYYSEAEGKYNRAKDIVERKNSHLRKGRRAGRFTATFKKLNKIRKIVGAFGGIAKILSAADYLDDIRSCLSFCNNEENCGAQ
jgi:hypothetical protein